MIPVDILVSKQGWSIQFLGDNHCRGVWALCGPVVLHLDAVRELLDSTDDDVAVNCGLILGGVCEWLPTVTEGSPTEAIKQLNTKLSAVPVEQLGRFTVWADAVNAAYERIIELRDEHGALAGVESGRFTEPAFTNPFA